MAFIFTLMILLIGCGPRVPPTTASSENAAEVLQPKEGAVIEIIEETAVGNLAGIDMPMANVTNNYTYTLPDGTQGRGKACLLILPNADVWVGLGSEVAVGDHKWRVIKIHSPEGETGSVTLEQILP